MTDLVKRHAPFLRSFAIHADLHPVQRETIEEAALYIEKLEAREEAVVKSWGECEKSLKAEVERLTRERDDFDKAFNDAMLEVAALRESTELLQSRIDADTAAIRDISGDYERARASLRAAEASNLRMLDFDLHGYHYWRECPACGYCGGGYLHCAHDGYQNPCHNCGARMPTLKGDCKCEFVLSHDAIREAALAASPPLDTQATTVDLVRRAAWEEIREVLGSVRTHSEAWAIVEDRCRALRAASPPKAQEKT